MTQCRTVGELVEALSAWPANSPLISHDITDIVVVPQNNGKLLITGKAAEAKATPRRA